MAVTVVKDVSDYNFSSGLQQLQFTTDKTSVKFTLKCGSETVLSETYVPDTSGLVTIFQLGELVEPYLTTNLIESFTYVIDDGDDTATAITKNFNVQLCKADSPMQANLFILEYFLSTLMGVKETAMGRKEMIYLVITKATDVTAVAEYYDESYNITQSNVKIASLSDLNKVLKVDASPKQFYVPGKTLLGYTIKAGDRIMTFKIVDVLDAAPCLIFTNSFGCQETLYCTGTHTLAPEYTRNATRCGGMFRNYNIEETRVFKANTGPLTPDMAIWAHDLFRSEEIYILDGSNIGNEITITESKDEQNNDFDNMPAYTFSYQYAQKNHNVLQLPRAGRIFDNTYDNTFE